MKQMPLSEYKLAPTHETRTHKEICVMVHKREAFYSITPDRMEQLLDAEAKLDDLHDLLNNLHSNGYLEYSVYSQLHDSL